MINIRKKTVLLLSASLLFAAGGLTARKISANAETEVGQHMLELTDISGNTVSLPVWYDGENYLLEDRTRNIFVHNGFEARAVKDLIANPDRYPIYSSPKGKFTDVSAVSLYANIITAYDFYNRNMIGENHFGLMGRDDKIADNLADNENEMPIHAFTHFNSEGFRFNATCYSEKNMGFLIVGDGDAEDKDYDMYRQAGSLDVIGHEYQHGIARFLNKGFTYEGESGALDEAFADIFGMLIAGDDPHDEDFWRIGEDSSITGKEQRRIDFPSLSVDKHYRDTMQSRYTCTDHYPGSHDWNCDNNYVHYNSTIITHAQYTAWELAPASFTRRTMATLWFNTLKLLGKDATFQDFTTAIRSVAKEQLDETARYALDYSLYVNGFIEDVMHTVTFADEDGTPLFSAAVPHGGSLEHVVPQFEDSNRYEYQLEIKEGSLQNVTEDITVKVSYEKKDRNYTVRFVQDDGTLIEEKSFAYGSALTYPAETPKKESDLDYIYTFSGWDGDFETVTDDLTLYAVYDKSPNPEKDKEDGSDSGSGNNEETEEKKNNLPLILGICGGAVVLIGVAVAIILVKKRK